VCDSGAVLISLSGPRCHKRSCGGVLNLETILQGDFMFRTTLLTVIAVFIFGLGVVVSAQQVDQRTQSLVAALDKTKYKKKEKKGLSIEFYIDVKNKPALRSTPSEYSGVYFDDQHRLELKVDANGSVTGSGFDAPYDGAGIAKFTLRDARVEGALLGGVKVYENGETRKFEAVFVDRTVSSGKNANDIDTSETRFGIGWLEGGSVVSPGTGQMNDWTNRIFLERR
jgi:hypothetical protein